MGFVKFARVFRFIGLFLGLNILAAGLLLMALNNEIFKKLLEETAAASGTTVEELVKGYYGQGIVIAIAGGALVVFGIICFIVYGANKHKLDRSTSSSYSSSSKSYANSNVSSKASYSNTANKSQTSSAPVRLSATSSEGFYGKGLIEGFNVTKKLTDLRFYSSMDSKCTGDNVKTVKEAWEKFEGADYRTEGASFAFKSVKGEIIGHYGRTGGNDPKHSEVYVNVYSITSLGKKVFNLFYESYMRMEVDGICVEFDIDNGDGSLLIAKGKDSSGHTRYAKLFEFSVYSSEMRDVYSLVSDPNNLVPLIELIADYGYYPPISDLFENISFVSESDGYNGENFHSLKEKFIKGLE